MQVTKRSTHARPGMHMQQCSAVPTQLAGASHVLCYRRLVLCYTTCWTCFVNRRPVCMIRNSPSGVRGGSEGDEGLAHGLGASGGGGGVDPPIPAPRRR